MAGIPFTAIYPDGPGTAAATGEAGTAFDAGGNPDYPGMPAGASPIHRDYAASGAGTYAVWTPGAGRRFVLASAFISTDTANRVALVDGTDAAGSRIVDAYFAANGGASPNLVPVPYPSAVAGQSLALVVAGGNVRVRVSGWEVPA
jgi:hypothetical protein